MSRIYRRLGNILGVRPGKVMLDFLVDIPAIQFSPSRGDRMVGYSKHYEGTFISRTRKVGLNTLFDQIRRRYHRYRQTAA